MAGGAAGRSQEWRFGPPADLVLWGALGGGLIGVAVLLGDFFTWGDDDWERARDGTFGVWLAAIAAQTIVWALAFPVIREIASRWQTPAAARSREVMLATAALALIGLLVAGVPPLTGDLPDTIPNRGLKVFLLNAIAFGLAIYAARAMWFAAREARALGRSGTTDIEALQRHADLREDVQALLRVLGALVTLAVVASAALRAFTAAVDPERALPAGAVVVYGLTLSLVLALVYAPAHLALAAAGRELREAAAPLVAPADVGFDGRVALRERLDSLLGLNVDATAALRAGVAILSPLIGSVLTLLPNLG